MGKKKPLNSKIPAPDSSTRSLENFESPNKGKLVKLLYEVKESLHEILNEFLSDFLLRKDRRLSSKSPTFQMHTYNLVVNKSYQKKIRKQIYALISTGFAIDMQEILRTQVKDFVDSLERYLTELRPLSKILQIIFLFDAYHTLQNASSEIGKIVPSIYKAGQQASDYLFMKEFYIRVIVSSQELLGQAGDYDKSHFAIAGVVKMQSHLMGIVKEEVLMEVPEKLYVMSDSESEEITESEPLYNLPIDDLVMYIEGKGKNKANRRRTAASSISPNTSKNDYAELDKEIDEFRQRIDIPITAYRPSLRLSQEFLEQLRKSLLRSKVN